MIEYFYFPCEKKNFNKLIIFDRDDTLIRDVPSLKSESDIRWLSGRLDLLKSLNQESTLIAIATNQSAIGRGTLSVHEFQMISDCLHNQLKNYGIDLWSIVACPHIPTDNCSCRKPKSELLNRLIERTNSKTLRVLFVGNTDSDMAAAKGSRFEVKGVKLFPNSLENFDFISKFSSDLQVNL